MRFTAILIFLYVLLTGITDAFALPVLGKKFQPAEIIFFVLSVAVIVQILKRNLKFQKLDIVDIGVIVYLALEIISAVYWNERSRWLEVIATGYLSAVYFILKTFFGSYQILPRQMNLTIAIAGCLGAALGITGWILAQFYIRSNFAWPVNYDYPYLRHVGRATGWMSGPNMLHNFLGICFLWFLSIRMTTGKKSSFHIWLLIFIGIGMVLTFSKNILLLGIAVLLLWNLSYPQPKWIRTLSIGASSIILIIFMIGTHFVVVNTNTSIWEKRLDHSYFIDKILWQSGDMVIVPTSYSLLRETALDAGLQYPVFGIGPGSHHKYVATLKKEGKFPMHFENYDPHSIFLGSFATLGVPGLLVIIWLTILVWKKLSRLRILTYNKPLVPFLKASMLFMLLDGINMDILHFRHLWILMGIIASFNLVSVIEKQGLK